MQTESLVEEEILDAVTVGENAGVLNNLRQPMVVFFFLLLRVLPQLPFEYGTKGRELYIFIIDKALA